MKATTPLVVLLLVVLSQNSKSQTLSLNELAESGEWGHTSGYSPKSLETLVGYTTIIVKGTYGELLGNRLFWGYRDGKELAPEVIADEQKISIQEVYDQIGIPMSEYRIAIDEVLLGNIEKDEIILRKYEPPPINRTLTHPEEQRIFFLHINPDNTTYAVAGDASILTNIEGVYLYDDTELVQDDSGYFYESNTKKPLDFLPSMEANRFEELLRSEISRQSTSN